MVSSRVTSRSEQRLTKRQSRLAEKGVEKFPTINQLHFDLKPIKPMTHNQGKVFSAYKEESNVCLIGAAGTGKTFLSIYLALQEISDKCSPRRKLIIIRTAQPSKQIGFLPGDEKRKLEVYEAPYKAICSELYHRADAYEILKQKGIIEFHGTSFLRGTTLEDSIILIDEIQNMGYQEMRTVVTRLGNNSRLVICGDIRQDDLTSERYKETSGLSTLLQVLQKMNQVTTVEFYPEDVVRSGFVREFLLAEYDLRLY